jgi:hypothetical protein
MKPLYLLVVAISICVTSIFAQEDKALYQTIWGTDKIHLNLSVPFINYIHAVPQGESLYEETGLLGFSIGVNLCNNYNHFKSLQIGVTSARPPGESFPDSTGWEYARAAMSFFVNARQNHVWKRLDIGYGPLLSYHGLRYGWFNNEQSIDSVITHNNWGLGGSFTAYFRVVYFLYAGVLYQPQLFSLSDGFKMKYEHVLSFDILFRLDLSRKVQAD